VEKKESFYERFFLAAQKILPRHEFRRICMMSKNLTNKNLSAEEVRTLLGPLVEEIKKEHGIEKAKLIFREAVIRAGLNPDEVYITDEPEPPS